MSAITTHILDATLGQPAAGVQVRLLQWRQDAYVLLDQKLTDADGRIKDFALDELAVGAYQLIFEVKPYFQQKTRSCFYPRVNIEFEVESTVRHYHVPLLISPYSYSTYRGS